MPDLMWALLSVLGMWLAAGSIFAGLGLFLSSLFYKEGLDFDDLFLCFWLGWAAAIGILLLAHFWLPIDWRASTVLALLGLCGIVRSRNVLRAFFRTVTWSTSWIFAVFLLGLTLWLADLALAAPDFFDSGNYHLTAIRWATAFPIIRGLGNLDTHLAFNNSTFLYQAALECGFWYGRSSHIGNGLLVLVLVTFCFVKVRHVFLQKSFADPRSVSPVFFLPLCLTMACDAGTSAIYNPGTDLPATVVCFVISWILVDVVVPRPLETPARGRFRFLSATVLCACAPTIKLSALCYAASAWLVILIYWWSRPGMSRSYRKRTSIISGMIVSYFGVVWITATTMLSGYPLFPSSILPLPVDWRIPRLYADGANWLIVLFARTGYQTGVSAEGLDWVKGWLQALLRGSRTWGTLPIALILLALMYRLSRLRIHGSNPNGRLESLSILLPGVIAVSVWLFTAPSLRFGSGMLWIIASQLCCGAIKDLARLYERRAELVLLGCCLLACAGPLSAVELASRRPGTSWLRAAEEALLVAPGPDHGFHPVPPANLVKQRSRYGVECFVPARRDAGDWREQLIWDCPLPGTEQMNPYLMLRGTGLSSGFRIHEDMGTWASRNAVAVKEAHLKTGGNVGRTAAHLGVTPAAVREALRQLGSANVPPAIQ